MGGTGDGAEWTTQNGRHTVDDAVNPALPAAYDIAWSASIVVWVAIAVIFCVKVVRDQTLTPGSKLLWIAVIVCAPVVGVIAWFASADWRRGSQHTTAHRERESQSVR